MLKTTVLPILLGIALFLGILYVANTLIQDYNPIDIAREEALNIRDRIDAGLSIQTVDTIIIISSSSDIDVKSITLYIDGVESRVSNDKFTTDIGIKVDEKYVLAIVPLNIGVLEKVVVDDGDREYMWTGEIQLGNGGVYIIEVS